YHSYLPTTYSFFSYCYCDHPDRLSFPTRRSSDLSTPHFFYLRSLQKLLAGAYSCSGRDAEPERDRVRWSGPMISFGRDGGRAIRSEEHTSELQSRENLVCRLLLEKKKKNKKHKKR